MVDNVPVLVKVANGKVVTLKPEMIAGRQAECDLHLVEGHASRRHARIITVGNDVWIEDMQSANGTFVNGVRIAERVKLLNGDRVRFDVEEFDFKGPTQPVVDDENKTVFRAMEPAAIDALSSAVSKRPGAWADPDAMGGDSANKTRFIEPSQLKQMMSTGQQPRFESAQVIDGPHLQVSSGRRAGISIRLTVGEAGRREWTIGSDPQREVLLQDSGVSALHARIVNEGARWKVLDQMSANGTFVNDKRTNVSYLSAGDRLRFGPVECVFHPARDSSRGSSSSSYSKGSSAGSEAPAGRSKMLMIAATAFIATMAILFVVYKFVM
jgi:pSer/pThr/pTyr-binding forkhead associated (FHA) protein